MNWFMKLFFEPSVVSATYDDEVLSVKYSDGTTVKYQGSSTVWYKLPYMGRCGTSKEYQLSGIYTYIKKWGNDYPNAHLSSEKNETT